MANADPATMPAAVPKKDRRSSFLSSEAFMCSSRGRGSYTFTALPFTRCHLNRWWLDTKAHLGLAKPEPSRPLNHAHICGLFDIGHQDGTDFLVMEYLEGETLAARLAHAFEAATTIMRFDQRIDRVPANASTR